MADENGHEEQERVWFRPLTPEQVGQQEEVELRPLRFTDLTEEQIEAVKRAFNEATSIGFHTRPEIVTLHELTGYVVPLTISESVMDTAHGPISPQGDTFVWRDCLGRVHREPAAGPFSDAFYQEMEAALIELAQEGGGDGDPR